MSKKHLGRAALAVLAGFAAFGLSACTWGDGDGDRGRGDGGFTRHDPPAHWDPGWHDHDRGHDRDRGDHERGGRDHERGGRDRDRAELAPSGRELTTLASVDERTAGKMFDGSK